MGVAANRAARTGYAGDVGHHRDMRDLRPERYGFAVSAQAQVLADDVLFAKKITVI